MKIVNIKALVNGHMHSVNCGVDLNGTVRVWNTASQKYTREHTLRPWAMRRARKAAQTKLDLVRFDALKDDA